MTARKILRVLADPVDLALLNAPADDEPISKHECAALDEANRRKSRGEAPIQHEDILREFGLAKLDLRAIESLKR